MLIHNTAPKYLNFVTTWSGHLEQKDFTVKAHFKFYLNCSLAVLTFAWQFTLVFPFRNNVDLTFNSKKATVVFILLIL